MNSLEKVSLYIPIYNGAKYLKECLKCVSQQKYPIDEILIIDDGSDEELSEIVSLYPVRLIKHEVNKGLASARNTAVQKAKNDFIMSIDVDCLIEPTWLELCMKNFQLPRIAAVGGCMMERNNKEITERWRAVHMKHHWGEKKIVNPAFLSGSNMVIRKEVFEKTGLYNERYKTNYEDVDMSSRIREKGYDLIYEPDAKAWHIKEDTVRTLLESHWAWRTYLFNKKFITRLFFHFSLSIHWILKDVLKGRIGFIFLNILTFPVSVYLDIKNLSIMKRG